MSLVAPAKVTPKQDRNPLVLHGQPRFPQALLPLPHHHKQTPAHSTADPGGGNIHILMPALGSPCKPWQQRCAVRSPMSKTLLFFTKYRAEYLSVHYDGLG